MKPRWAEYEALAHKIVGELAPYATVTHNDYVYGAESETKRQIDVSVRWHDGDLENLMIIQVKDHRRRANINTVGEFRSVILDVGAHKGILVCSGGFSKQALTYARNTGILLWSLADAKSKNWADELTVPVVFTKLTPELSLDGSFRAATSGVGLVVRDIDGSPFNFLEHFESAWNSGELSFETGLIHEFAIEKPLFAHVVAPDDGGSDSSVFSAKILYEVHSESYIVHLSPSNYRGVRDHLEHNRFIPSYFDLTIPALNNSSWLPISDPARIALSINDTFVVLRDARIIGPWPQPIFNLVEIDERTDSSRHAATYIRVSYLL